MINIVKNDAIVTVSGSLRTLRGVGHVKRLGLTWVNSYLLLTLNIVKFSACLAYLFYFISFYFIFLWKYNLYVEKWYWEYSLRHFYKLNTSGVTGTHIKKWRITLFPRSPLVPLPSNYPTYPRGTTILTSNSKSTFAYFRTLVASFVQYFVHEIRQHCGNCSLLSHCSGVAFH